MAAIEPRGAVTSAPTISRSRRTAHFLRHSFEMRVPMGIGFAVCDLIYFWAVEQQGYGVAETRRTADSARTPSPPPRSSDHPSRESPRRVAFATDGGAGTRAPLRR